MPKVTRREFLKFIAAGGIVAFAGLAGFSSLAPKNNNSTKRQAMAQSLIHWSSGPDTFGHAVHVALLRDGRVLYVGGSGWHVPSWNDHNFRAGIWNPNNGDHHEILPQVDKDLFCCGQSPLANGNILFAGGTTNYRRFSPNNRYWGLDAAYEFDIDQEQFIERTSMHHGRWYPTLLELDDKRILTVEGYDEFGYHNLLSELYNPATDTWTISYDPNASRTYTVGCDSKGCAAVPGSPGPSYGGSNMGVAPGGIGLYPRMHLMPSGLVALVGQGATLRVWNPETNRWHGAGSVQKRSYGTSVLLPLQNSDTEPGKILVCGGSATSDEISVDTASIIEPNSTGFSLNVRDIHSMSNARRYCNPVILPDGKIIIFGGTGKANLLSQAVYVPELFDPETEAWSTPFEADTIPRMYHSGAILLQDGRVWTMGTSYNEFNFEPRTEIFSPDYCFASRPVISGTPTGGEYGDIITIPTPDPLSIQKVSLVKVSTTTHHYNTDQRLIWLDIQSKTSDEVIVSAPLNSRLAPPGYYMVHVLDNQGVPSEGAMIQIESGPADPIFYNVPLSGGTTSLTLKPDGDTRAGVEVRLGSSLVGKQLKSWTVYLKRVTTAPTGSITAVIRNKSDDPNAAPRAIFDQPIQASTLTTAYKPYVFTLTDPYTIRLNDLILIEYNGPYAVRMDMWSVDKFEQDKTRRTKFTSAGKYSPSSVQDVSGIMSSE
ncbi:MAG TPA: kelch motif-containing protein [Nitrososphaera sp.]|nr:kelch motif-containing protein [Nitrososphaera sp.]